MAKVDEVDYRRLVGFKWCAHSNRRGGFYADRYVVAVRAAGTRSGWRNLQRTMQEEIMGRPPERGLTVDHANGDTLDNRRRNLRWATRREQAQNRMKPNRWGLKGIFANDQRKFTARITVDGKRLTLGTFATPEEAARAYNNAARAHFGAFARLNPV